MGGAVGRSSKAARGARHTKISEKRLGSNYFHICYITNLEKVGGGMTPWPPGSYGPNGSYISVPQPPAYPVYLGKNCVDTCLPVHAGCVHLI